LLQQPCQPACVDLAICAEALKAYEASIVRHQVLGKKHGGWRYDYAAHPREIAVSIEAWP